MNQVNSTIQCHEEEFPSFEVSDEALEGAAGADALGGTTRITAAPMATCPSGITKTS